MMKYNCNSVFIFNFRSPLNGGWCMGWRFIWKILRANYDYEAYQYDHPAASIPSSSPIEVDLFGLLGFG